LNPVLYEMPPLALDAVRRELAALGQRVREQLDLAMAAILAGKDIAVGSLQSREQRIDQHHAEIVHYVQHLLQQELAADTGMTAVDLVEAADYLESLGDLVEKELVPLYERQRAADTAASPDSMARLAEFATAVSGELQRALDAVENADHAMARGVLDAKPELRRLERALRDADPRIERAASEREIAETLRRAYSLVRRLVTVGTGLLRVDMDRAGDTPSHAD
jgi:phosphate:Na+ symporter